MLTSYNTAYLKNYKRYRDILDTEAIIVGKKDGTYQAVYKVKALPHGKKDIFFDLQDNNTSEVTFLKEDLLNLKSIDDLSIFPINTILSKIESIRYAGHQYSLISTRNNLFDNLITFVVSKKL